MRQSKYFLKTSKNSAEDDKIASSRLLRQAGYVRESVAGRYYFLPVGHKVQQRIMKVVKEEMDNAGSQEMLAPTLHPLELWKETNRTNTAGFELMKVEDRRGAEFALGGTAEEMFVDLIRKFSLSYRDLPMNVYQFSNKFRDEMRARGGLLRVREFIMKDAYSFHTTEQDFAQEYEKMKQVYSSIFKRLGLETYFVESDNGYIGGEYCHEFIVESEVGESRFFVSEKGSYAAHEDVATFQRRPADTEEMLPLETIEQPEWVQTMDDNEKHYGKPRHKYLKNVVYKNQKNGEIIIAALTGDLEANKTKLEHVVDAVGQLEAATDEDLAKIGTKTGYVHSWGHHGVRYIGDISLADRRNLIGGQKEETTDTFNVNYGRDFTCEVLADIAMAQPGDTAMDGGTLVERKGIEVGNIFQLGYHYTKLMQGATFKDADGEDKPYYMGCYGIGIGRTMAAIVEKFNDDKGIIWPESVAPFKVHLIALAGKDGKEVTDAADKLYADLQAAGVEVLYDDREGSSAGEKFADSDLIGIPHRIVVSQKTLAQESVEIKNRSETEAKLIPLASAVSHVQ